MQLTQRERLLLLLLPLVVVEVVVVVPPRPEPPEQQQPKRQAYYAKMLTLIWISHPHQLRKPGAASKSLQQQQKHPSRNPLLGVGLGSFSWQCPRGHLGPVVKELLLEQHHHQHTH
jgi:hypothetical protein